MVGGRCPECGEGVERPRHLEVWRDPEAVEELVPVQDVESGPAGLAIRSGEGVLKVPRPLIHEVVASMVKRGDALYAKLLKVSPRQAPGPVGR